MQLGANDRVATRYDIEVFSGCVVHDDGPIPSIGIENHIDSPDEMHRSARALPNRGCDQNQNGKEPFHRILLGV